jgi:16S rRNA (cytosine1402-N4)-methyltransferase
MGAADGAIHRAERERRAAGVGGFFALSAPAHRPVLLIEAIDALNVKEDGTYVDCTYGRGGHSRAILERLGVRGRLVALDRDPQAVQAAADIRDPRFTIHHASFGRLAEVLSAEGLARVDGVLMDLGVSSPQLADAARGFSFRLDGPLDMRMDTTRGITAEQWLADASEDEIREVIRTYGEERFAGPIARAIVAARSRGALRTTGQLAQVVGQALRTREPGQDPATRTFQAVRIFINQELEELPLALEQAAAHLAAGGRLVVISFHSLEDRLVKRFLRSHAQPPPVPRGLAVREAERPRPTLRLVGKARRPGAAEMALNPRSRSATLRVAERLAARGT